jgi:hypothetical protein
VLQHPCTELVMLSCERWPENFHCSNLATILISPWALMASFQNSYGLKKIVTKETQ